MKGGGFDRALFAKWRSAGKPNPYSCMTPRLASACAYDFKECSKKDTSNVTALGILHDNRIAAAYIFFFAHFAQFSNVPNVQNIFD